MNHSKEPTPNQFTIIQNDEIDIKALWMVLWRNKKSLFKITGGFVLLMVLYLFITTPLFYASSTLFETSGETSSSLDKLGGLASVAGFDMGSMGSEETFVDLTDYVNSRRLKDEILNRKWPTKKKNIDLITYWEINDTTGIINFLKNLIKPSKLAKEELKLKWLYKAHSKLEDRIIASYTETGLFTVEVWMEDPVLTQTMADYIVSSIVNYSNEVKADKWRETREFSLKRLGDVNKELDKAEDILTKFQKENRRIIDSPDMMVELASLTRDVTIKTQLLITLQNEYEFARIEESKDMTGMVILDEAQYPVEVAYPQKILLLLLSIVIGCVLSIPFFLFYRALK
ncbi:MAG: hypothetical protein CMG64_06830 [Candidatus Marinimicrobia bacterium]|nr:hypothetical protein [Candidatus Neomarinimicrobiota bacterium]|tara:strand:- start:686 stop:1714 length:1029 start_codon:yes stop_codon:yes gene_type:complete